MFMFCFEEKKPETHKGLNNCLLCLGNTSLPVTMSGKKLAVFILLIVSMELLFGVVDGGRRRRRRRRRCSLPPPPPPPKCTPPPPPPKCTPPPPTPPPPPPTKPPCNSSIPQYSGIKWHNKWHQTFKAFCPYSYSMSQWISLFRHCQEDRIHYMRCRKGPAVYDTFNCNWSPHVLYDVRHSFFYKCRHQGFINGVWSYFDAAVKDRRIKVRCCHVYGYEHYNCKTTPYVNVFGGLLNFRVPPGYTLVGVGSYHSVAVPAAKFSDRRWMFEICQVKKKQCKE